MILVPCPEPMIIRTMKALIGKDEVGELRMRKTIASRSGYQAVPD